MFSLPNIGDISKYITSWQSEIQVSYQFTDLFNGKIERTSDLGIGSDKFYSIIDLSIPFSFKNSFVATFNVLKSFKIDCYADCDLFFPGLVLESFKCMLVDLKSMGYEDSNNFSRFAKYQMKVYLPTVPEFEQLYNVPSCLERALWENDYHYSDNFSVTEFGQKTQFYTRFNDLNSWSVSLDYLTLDEAFQLMSWILTMRTDSVSLVTSPINCYSISTTKTANYKIKDFDFQRHNRYYSAVLNLIEV